jgi:hypothetical protein
MLIKSSRKHLMMLQTPPEGRYKVRLIGVKEEENKKKDGTNAVLEFEISSGEFEGRRGIQTYIPLQKDFGIAQLTQLHCALENVELFEWEGDLEEDLGKECIAELTHELYNGAKQIRISTFIPTKNPITGADTPLSTPF